MVDAIGLPDRDHAWLQHPWSLVPTRPSRSTPTSPLLGSARSSCSSASWLSVACFGAVGGGAASWAGVVVLPGPVPTVQGMRDGGRPQVGSTQDGRLIAQSLRAIERCWRRVWPNVDHAAAVPVARSVRVMPVRGRGSQPRPCLLVPVDARAGWGPSPLPPGRHVPGSASRLGAHLAHTARRAWARGHRQVALTPVKARRHPGPRPPSASGSLHLLAGTG